MAQPATAAPAVAAPQELTFASEEARDQALEALGKDGDLGPEDLAEIDRIENAKIVPDAQGTPAPQPASGASAQPASPQPAPAQPAAQPQQSGAQPAPEEQPRDWHITEQMITQFDEEFDERQGDGSTRRRRTITQRNPEDLLKTVVHEQRRIRYLRDKALPDAHNEGYEKARSELTPQIEKLQKELDEARKRVVAAPQPTAQPSQASAQPASAASDTAGIDAARKTLADTFKSLEGVESADMIDHVPELMGGLKASVAVIDGLNQRLLDQSKIIDDLKAGKLAPLAPAPAAQPAAQQVAPAVDTQQEEAIRRYREGCKMVDGFVATPVCPGELKMDIGFDAATTEAMGFHRELASHYSGKTPGNVTNEDMRDAVAAYLAENPKLLARVHAAGLTEPPSYRKWVVLDQVDAMRNGWFRDPHTKEWKQRHSEDTGRPVQFPDMQSAYNEYLRVTGQDKARVNQAVRENTRQMVDAMTRRDQGLVQMDVSRTLEGSAAIEATVKQAEEFLETHGYEDVRSRARRGDRSLWDQYNASLKALGQDPLPDSLLA